MPDAAQMALRYDVNLSILFTELPLLQRPAAAAEAGFDAVELWWPFPEPVPSDRDLDQLRDAILDSGTRLVGLNFDAGNMAAGERGLLSRPTDSERFRANIDVAVGFAASLGCTVLNALYGNWDPESSVPEQREIATENLVLAARSAERAGATVVIEALNNIESPDYPITSSHEALDLIEYLRVIHDVPNIAFLADLYHLARMGEPVEQLIERRADRFGHVQIADPPGRGQPGTGNLDWPILLDRLAASEYRGYVGLEYKPVGQSADSFGWLPRHLRSAAAVEESV
ncbi:hydroxypyruvate isomerase family protein [Pseudonocardia alaniniphila]|uniref:TIM barrel protein n=1 Tax=Pseudonocardia alaniniphila TaxID=75291 RepID=A0ABS9TNA9_9PSEU|nr:TIM barrel protein [Pseudonocardia alaniniphila]MCH6169888.1 TIM barrel protein [Pseudonocardia alaniniphila]